MMSTHHFCQQSHCTLNTNNTFFPPSPPPSPPNQSKDLRPARVHVPSDEQLLEALKRAKKCMDKNQISPAKICAWIREMEATWALTEKRLKKTLQPSQAPPSPSMEVETPKDNCCASPPKVTAAYTQQAAPKRPSHKCKTMRKRKSPSAVVVPEVVTLPPAAEHCSDHATCGPKCSVWRVKKLDKRLDALACEIRDVTIRVRVSEALVAKANLVSDESVSLNLHVFADASTESEYVLAPELVRSYLPKVCRTGGTLMHSIYTYNHAYGRGTPLSSSTRWDWRAWSGCPQALAKKASSVLPETEFERFRERIWLVDGQAEIMMGPECEPEKETIDPPVVSSKGKNRA